MPDWLKGLKRWQTIAREHSLPGLLIYGGEDAYQRESIEVCPWKLLGQAAR